MRHSSRQPQVPATSVGGPDEAPRSQHASAAGRMATRLEAFGQRDRSTSRDAGNRCRASERALPRQPIALRAGCLAGPRRCLSLRRGADPRNACPMARAARCRAFGPCNARRTVFGLNAGFGGCPRTAEEQQPVRKQGQDHHADITSETPLDVAPRVVPSGSALLREEAQVGSAVSAQLAVLGSREGGLSGCKSTLLVPARRHEGPRPVAGNA